MSVYAKVWAYDQHPLQIDKQGNPKPKTRNPAAKAVLIALAEFPGVGQRECWPSQETLALMTDFEERTVRRHLAALEAQGLIKRTERRRKGQRLTDMVTLLGPVEAFGPASRPPDTDSGSGAEATGHSDQSHRTQCPGNRHKEPSVITPVGASDDATGNATADEFVSFLAEELDTADVPYTKGWRGRHGKQFKECIAKGVEGKTLYKACDRVVERWTGEEHRKLTVDQALEDVVNGKPPANVTPLKEWDRGTPAELIDYVFDNTRSPYVKSCERRLRSTMARFDFSSEEQPPWKIEKELGGTDSERWATLDALRCLCRRGQAELEAS